MNPYENLPAKAFWKPSVSSRNLFDIEELWEPKFEITKEKKIATYGSCFAKHFGRNLLKQGFHWYVTEKAPEGFPEELISPFNYNLFSSRTGNIYTSSLLKQWVTWAKENQNGPEEVWEKENQFYDPFRPRIEPEGFESKDEMMQARAYSIECFKESISKADIFVFTLGLTESWIHKTHSYEYPMCPGTVGGKYEENQHQFLNQSFSEVLSNLEESIALIRSMNNQLKFIFTVSPVPLTATNSGKHVLVSTMRSKSILRSVAAQLEEEYDYVDYFPSFEIISSPPFKGTFFEPNQRSVSPFGVNFVMQSFFKAVYQKYSPQELTKEKAIDIKTDEQEVDDECDQVFLENYDSSQLE